MHPVLAAMEAARNQYVPQLKPILDKVIQYLESGNPTLLAEFRADPRGHHVEHLSQNVVEAAHNPLDLDAIDSRALKFCAAAPSARSLWLYLERWLSKEKGGQDMTGACWQALEGSVPRQDFLNALAQVVETRESRGQPNSAGRALITASDQELRAAIAQAGAAPYQAEEVTLDLLSFLLAHDAERLPAVVDEFFKKLERERGQVRLCYRLAERLMTVAPATYDPLLQSALANVGEPYDRALIARALYRHDPSAHRSLMLQEGRHYLKKLQMCSAELGAWLITEFGLEMRGDMVKFMGKAEWAGLRRAALQAAVKRLGLEAMPIVKAALEAPQDDLRWEGLEQLIQLDAGGHRDLILQRLQAGLAGKDEMARLIDMAGRFDPAALEKPLMGLLLEKPKKDRDLRRPAARALGRLGDAILPQAQRLLAEKKAEPRAAAVQLLAAVASEAAQRVLEERLDQEQDQEVRDDILEALAPAWKAAGKRWTRSEVEARVTPGAPPAPWVGVATLPPLLDKEQQPLPPAWISYLLYRQSRARTMAPDPEARAVLDLIDLSRSGEFAHVLLQRFLNEGSPAKDRWALTLAAWLGDGRTVAALAAQVPKWADTKRVKMAEEAIAVLAMRGSTEALAALDQFSSLYSSKNPSLGRAAVEAFLDAAEREGVTPQELGDRIVPWLGFTPGQPRQSEGIEVSIGSDFKLLFRDASNKLSATLPKTASAALKQQVKELSSALKSAANVQAQRLESLLVQQQRWPRARWEELFLGHPLLRPFAIRLVWQAQGLFFRALDDLSLTDADDEPVELPGEARIGMVHPLDMTAEQVGRWRLHLADHRLTPPFPQLDRPVLRREAGTDQQVRLRTVEGHKLFGLTFRGRAEKLGWIRGATEGAAVLNYLRPFPSAGLDACLETEGLYFGITRDEQIVLGGLRFIRTGSLDRGNYSGDSPQDQDPRVVPFGQVPDLVYSEVAGDLERILGS